MDWKSAFWPRPDRKRSTGAEHSSSGLPRSESHRSSSVARGPVSARSSVSHEHNSTASRSGHNPRSSKAKHSTGHSHHRSKTATASSSRPPTIAPTQARSRAWQATVEEEFPADQPPRAEMSDATQMLGVPPSDERLSSMDASERSSTLVNDPDVVGPETTAAESTQARPPHIEPAQPDPDYLPRWRWSANLPHLCKHLALSNSLPYEEIDTAELSAAVSAGYYVAFAADLSTPDALLAVAGRRGEGYEEFFANFFAYDNDLLVTRIDSGPKEGSNIVTRLRPVETVIELSQQRQAHHARVIDFLSSIPDPRARLSEDCGGWLCLTSKTTAPVPVTTLDRTDEVIKSLLSSSATKALNVHERSTAGLETAGVILNQNQINLSGWLERGRHGKIARNVRYIWNGREGKIGERALTPLVPQSCTDPFDPSVFCGVCAPEPDPPT